MLTNEQIEDLAKRMNFPLEGVYFKNELPRKLKYNTGYVINLQNSEDEDGNDNDGTHWTCLQVNKYPSGLIEPIFFDPYGAPPSEAIKKFVKDGCGKHLPYTQKDIQSLMNNACGYYCCAFLHFINTAECRSKDLYVDVSDFLELFNDLNVKNDYKYNEFVLKHFFRSADPAKRRAIEVITGGTEHISSENDSGVKIPVEVKTIG
jgi:hypothetical protein